MCLAFHFLALYRAAITYCLCEWSVGDFELQFLYKDEHFNHKKLYIQQAPLLIKLYKSNLLFIIILTTVLFKIKMYFTQ